MTDDELFSSQPFQQIPGQISMADRTWDGEPLWSPDSVTEALHCDICGDVIRGNESSADRDGEITHTACVGDWFRRSFGAEELA